MLFAEPSYVFEGRGTAVDCIKRDISDIGARLQFDKPLVLNELLDRHNPHQGGQKFYAGKSAGTTATWIGVTFQATAHKKADDTARR